MASRYGAASNSSSSSESDSDGEPTSAVLQSTRQPPPSAAQKRLGIALSIRSSQTFDESEAGLAVALDSSGAPSTDHHDTFEATGIVGLVALPPLATEENPFLDADSPSLLARPTSPTLPSSLSSRGKKDPVGRAVGLPLPFATRGGGGGGEEGAPLFAADDDEPVSELIQALPSLSTKSGGSGSGAPGPVLSAGIAKKGIAARRGVAFSLPGGPPSLAPTLAVPPAPSPESFNVSASGAFRFGQFKVGAQGVQGGVSIAPRPGSTGGSSGGGRGERGGEGYDGEGGAASGPGTTVRLEDLELIASLGEGAQGHVDKVRHRPSGVLLAKKTMRVDMAAGPEADKKRRELFTEVKTYMESLSPYVVHCQGCFFNDGLVTMVLEYMDCGSLESVLKRTGQMEEAVIAAIGEQAAHGLAYLHKSRHLVHRDIKPANILLNTDGEVKITDFGVSKEVAGSIANCETFVGTFLYMSPERIDTTRASGYTFAVDVWALALVLVECAAGSYPYPLREDNMFDYMNMVCNQDPPVEQWLPKDRFSDSFRDLVTQCLARDASKRPTAEAMASHPFFTQRALVDLAGILRDATFF